MHRTKIITGLTALLMLLGVLAASPASASTVAPPSVSAQQDAANQGCAQAAVGKKLKTWVCVAGELTAPGLKTTRQLVGVTPMSTDPVWCITGGMCHRKISNYIGDSQANGIYGDLRGVIGGFQLGARTTLNGRQENMGVKFAWRSGPTMRNITVDRYCYEQISWWPDNPCGSWVAFSGRVVSRVSSSTGSPVLYGNKLINEDPYYDVLEGHFTADGHPGLTFDLGSPETIHFYCPGGNGRCYIP